MLVTASVQKLVVARYHRDHVLRASAIACLFGAEIIHVDAMAHHWAEWPAAGVFFLLLSVVEGVLAALLLVRPSPEAARTAVAVSLATVAFWGISRSFGLPIGPYPGQPEPIGLADAIATLFEIATAVSLVAVAASRSRSVGTEGESATGGPEVALIATGVGLLTLIAAIAPHPHV
jgi:hypothetical protein